MKLAALLKTHQSFQQKGLEGNFGDGYLAQHNRVYRQIRSSALAKGYRFTLDRDEAYEAFPLLQLERLLKEKVFPYSDNVKVFESMLSKQLEVLEWEDLIGNLKRNFVFHEGAHAVVRDLVLEHFGEVPKDNTLAGQRAFVLRVLLEESFANTAELLGVIDVEDAVHRAFYELNSYNTLFESRTNLKKAMEEMGPDLLIPFFILCYLYVNFLRESFSENDLRKIMSMIGDHNVTTGEFKTLKSVAKLTFELSEVFRYQTTGFHLKINGITEPLDEILDYDFFEELRQESKLTDFFKSACHVLWSDQQCELIK